MEPTVTATSTELVTVFSEWMRRYREEPDQFEDIAVSIEKGDEAYGQACSAWFVELLDEIQQAS